MDCAVDYLKTAAEYKVEEAALLLAVLYYEGVECGLNDEEAYEEISASAGIAAAMLERNNPLHTKHVQRALEGLLANVSEDGRVMNVSGGTAVMKDKEAYRSISKDWMQGWGQGLMLAFLAAVLENGFVG